MAEFLDAYKKQETAEDSPAQVDAEAIKDTPGLGPVPSAALGVDFSHQNAEAWELLKEELSDEAYEALQQAVIEKVGKFEKVKPEMDEE